MIQNAPIVCRACSRLPRSRGVLSLYYYVVILLSTAALPALGAEKSTQIASSTSQWPEWGGSSLRNNVAGEKASRLPVEWNIGKFDPQTNQWLSGKQIPTGGSSQEGNKHQGQSPQKGEGRLEGKGDAAKNVRWVARLGSESYGSPVIAGERVFCATNNGAGYLSKRYPATVDLGCLLCFAQNDGRFLWQHSVEKLAAGANVDWPKQGICCSPLIEGGRAYIVTNRGEVVSLDVRGKEAGESKPLWRFDMMGQLGVVQRYMACCSVTAAGELLLVGTSNGRESDQKIAAPDAPSFIALEKATGKLVWADNSPGANILDGQWSSPAFAVLGGAPQAIFAGGDGWLYSFDPTTNDGGKPKLLWKLDCNPKDAQWKGATGRRNTIISTPVIHDGRVYLATGQDPEAGEGPGDLWCIDPTRRGDVSPELVVDAQGKPVAVRRALALDAKAGERAVANPNSAAVWHYGGVPCENGAGSFDKVMHRSLGMPVIANGLLVMGDFSGLVHCLDVKTGRAHWTHDMLSAVWGSPLVADGKIYLGNDDGDVLVFELSPKLKVLAKNAMGNSVFGTPVALGNTLYIATRCHLFALAEGE